MRYPFRIVVLTIFAGLMVSCLFGQVTDFAQTNFTKADSMACLYPDHSLYDLSGLAKKLTSSLATDVEKFRAVHQWICRNIDNDYALYHLNKIRREKIKNPDALLAWNKKCHDLMFETLLEKKRTMCTGYAYLVRELALQAGLSCVIVDGYGRSRSGGGPKIPNHSWNAVRLNNKWYLCDATWASGAIDAQTKKFLKKYDGVYFLADPLVFVQKHYPLDSTWMLLDKKPSLEEFLSRPILPSGSR